MRRSCACHDRLSMRGANSDRLCTYPLIRWTTAQWNLVKRQEEVVTRDQLREFGYSDRSIDLQIGRLLNPVHRGVFAVGHTRMSQRRRWFAALLACGAGATL